jgi:hypothetical protein
MPQIIDTFRSSKTVLKAIDDLVRIGRQVVENHPVEVQVAGHWLDEMFTEEKAHAKWCGIERRSCSYSAEQLENNEENQARLCQLGYPNDRFRVMRLQNACEHLMSWLQSTQSSGFGSSKQRATNEVKAAWQMLVVGLLVADEDAQEYLGEVTDLAIAPWKGGIRFHWSPKGRQELVIFAPDVVHGAIDTSMLPKELQRHGRLALLLRALQVLSPDSLKQMSTVDAVDSVASSASLDEAESNEQSVGQTGGSGETTWQDVQGKLLHMMEQGHKYSATRTLAEECECSNSTIFKAIKDSPQLKEWMQSADRSRKSSKGTALSTLILDRHAQMRETSPESYVDEDDVDLVMAMLIQSAKTEQQRAILNNLNDEERVEMVKLCNEFDHDDVLDMLSSSQLDQNQGPQREHKQI